MKRSTLSVLCLGGILTWTTPSATQESPMPLGVQSVLVKLQPSLVSEVKYELRAKDIKDSALKEILADFNVPAMRSVFKSRYNEDGSLNEKVAQSTKNLLSGWFQLDLSDNFDPDEFIRMLEQHSCVAQAIVEVPLLFEPDVAPDDATYDLQWHLNDPSNPGFDIDAETAWDINRGRSDVIIAVLDGGVDYNHPDLDPGDRSRVIAGIDTGDGDGDPADDLPNNTTESYAGHGTNIAGVIGAITDNGQQVAGVMWHCSIMPVKMVRGGGFRIPHILDWDWSTTAFPSDVADAIDYAVVNGANVINLSYSFPNMGWPVNEMALRVPLLFEALNNAYQNNVVITASMGNHFAEDNSPRYPAGFDEQVIAVGGTDPRGARRSSSNTGPHIDISAPGSGIWTTQRGGGVDNPSGTSFSAPIVAGVAGLVISQGKDRNFDLTNDDVIHILTLTSNGEVGSSSGFDNETGHGIVNARRALELLDRPNVLYHYNAIGGTATKIATIDKWMLLDGRWGLAAGSYYQVDQYRITKHVTFDIPFCSPPVVWMRERESKSLDYANPNFGRPSSTISNVTKTGFDLEYVAYYVRYNASAQSINKWLPAHPSSCNVAYTAVGMPNLAALSTITGPSFVCQSTAPFSLDNVPAGASVGWEAVPSNLFSVASGSGVNASLAAASSSASGSATLTFTVTGPCSDPIQIRKNFWVGRPSILSARLTDGRLITYSSSWNNVCSDVQYTTDVTGRGNTGVSWSRVSANPSNTNWYATNNNVRFYFYSSGQTAAFRANFLNVCGTSAYDFKFQSVSCSSDPCSQYVVSPNPSSTEVNVAALNIPAPCGSLQSATAEPSETMENESSIQSLMLLDTDGRVQYSRSFSDKARKANIDVSTLKKGIYVLRISDGKFTESHRIMVE